MTWLERLLGWLGVERHDIDRRDIGPYLTRWVLAGRRLPVPGERRDSHGQKLYLHLFRRGDVENYCHDHPAPYWSLILWGGYWEVTPRGRHWYGPGRLLRRPADWQHRIEVPPGRTCLTLFWVGTRERAWGFVCPRQGWIPWQQHEHNQAAGLTGCGEEI